MATTAGIPRRSVSGRFLTLPHRQLPAWPTPEEGTSDEYDRDDHNPAAASAAPGVGLRAAVPTGCAGARPRLAGTLLQARYPLSTIR